MQGIAYEDHGSGSSMNIAGFFVTVAPESKFFEHKKENQSSQDNWKNPFAGHLLLSMRDHAKECRSEESADGIRNQGCCNKQHSLCLKQQQQRSQSDGTDRSEQCKYENQQEGLHDVLNMQFAVHLRAVSRIDRK
jgi:hypothetical protein